MNPPYSFNDNIQPWTCDGSPLLPGKILDMAEYKKSLFGQISGESPDDRDAEERVFKIHKPIRDLLHAEIDCSQNILGNFFLERGHYTVIVGPSGIGKSVVAVQMAIEAADLAAKLATLAPGDLRYTMFAVSGSEANERSMQIARQYWLASGKPGKHKVISLQGGYHGATMGTFAVCGLPHLSQAYQPLEVPGFAKVAPPHPFRDLGTGTEAELIARRIGELREAILREGPDTVSAVIMEPVLSSGGFIMPPIGWLRAVRALCDELDVLMIADEVITGFGRTGRWFAVEHDQVVPDLMSVAKGITSGYIPLSASIARGRLADAFSDTTTQENVHPNTYAAHPVACAAALANLKIMEQDRLVELPGQRVARSTGAHVRTSRSSRSGRDTQGISKSSTHVQVRRFPRAAGVTGWALVVPGPEVQVAAVQPVIDPAAVGLVGDGGVVPQPGQPLLGVGDGVQDFV